MSLLFADIYDGIRTIRITKGVSEKDILNFVQDKVGGCMSVANVLKTIRTLKKLCEEGVLMKKGKRYMFAPKGCRKEEDDDDEEEEDECQEEMQPQVADSCDECDDGDDNPDDDQGDDDDDDDDDDEEEEDDDDDDDDDDECDDKDVRAESEQANGKKCNEMETRSPIKSKESFLGGANGSSPAGSGGNNGDNGNGTPCLDKKVNRAMAGDSVKKSGNDKGRKGCKGKSVVEQETGDATSKGNEAIAFCVRDFIDSLGRPDTEGKDGKEKTEKSEALLEENMDLTKPLEFGREVSLRKRTFRNKRNAGRSRSPVKEVQAELYHCLGKGPSEEIGFREICSDFFQEPTDIDMDVDQKKEEEVTTLHRSLPTNSGEPCGETDRDMQDKDSVIIERSYDDFRETLAKKNSLVSQVQTNECPMGQMTWFPLEEREKEMEPETANRGSSCEDERTGGDKEKTVSLCSVCEKKKRSP